MFKKVLPFLAIAVLAAAVWAFAAGSAEDPLVSLSYLTGSFTESVEDQIDKALDASDAKLLESLKNGESITNVTVSWAETRLKQEDILLGTTGTNVMLLAGSGKVVYDVGTVVDVTTGSTVNSGDALVANHRYMVAENTSAAFSVTSKTAVIDYLGEYAFVYSDAVDYNAMASALKMLHLFKGSFTGFGEGFDLELAPTRLQALIMFIRVLGEEEAALSWSGTQPFKDIHAGTQAFQYVGYAYEKGYTNGYTTTEFRPAGAVNAYQYTEFVLRAMGYSSAANTNLADTMERAMDAGVLTEGEVEKLKVDPFLRAELVYISYYALQSRLPNSSQTLSVLLQNKGVFTSQEWKTAKTMVSGNRL